MTSNIASKSHTMHNKLVVVLVVECMVACVRLGGRCSKCKVSIPDEPCPIVSFNSDPENHGTQKNLHQVHLPDPSANIQRYLGKVCIQMFELLCS